MVRRIFRSGNSMVIVLSKDILNSLHLRKGDEVSVELDVGQDRIVIAPVPLAAAGIDKEFAHQVAEFMEAYRPALEALAR